MKSEKRAYCGFEFVSSYRSVFSREQETYHYPVKRLTPATMQQCAQVQLRQSDQLRLCTSLRLSGKAAEGQEGDLRPHLLRLCMPGSSTSHPPKIFQVMRLQLGWVFFSEFWQLSIHDPPTALLCVPCLSSQTLWKERTKVRKWCPFLKVHSYYILSWQL